MLLLRCIRWAALFLVLLTIYQLVFKDEIDWLANISITLIAFIINFLYEWAKTPYQWGKGRKE